MWLVSETAKCVALSHTVMGIVEFLIYPELNADIYLFHSILFKIGKLDQDIYIIARTS